MTESQSGIKITVKADNEYYGRIGEKEAGIKYYSRSDHYQDEG